MPFVEPQRLTQRLLVEWRPALVALRAAHVRGCNDPETLHKLRVATRRSQAAYRWARLASKRLPGLTGLLRAIMRQSGPARDADVLAGLLHDALPKRPGFTWGTWIGRADEQRFLARRAWLESQPGLLDRASRLDERLAAWIERPASPLKDRHCRRRLDQIRDEFRESLAGASKQPDTWHPLRLAAKRLRYAAETAPVDDGNLVGLIDQLRSLQTALGLWHDLRLAQSWLTTRAATGDIRSVLNRSLRRAISQVKAARRRARP